MARCPVDLTNCCDDLCYGGGCLKGGGEMLDFCQLCKQWHSPEDEFDICTYDDDDYELEDDDGANVSA